MSKDRGRAAVMGYGSSNEYMSTIYSNNWFLNQNQAKFQENEISIF